MKHLLIPAVGELSPEVLAGLAEPPPVSEMDQWVSLYNETCARLQKLLNTKAFTFIMTGSASCATEAAVCSLLEPGERILADSWVFNEPAQLYGGKVVDITPRDGAIIEPDYLRATLREHRDTKIVALLHNITGTGVTNPLKELGEVVHDSGALFIVDAVSSIGAIPIRMDDWHIDVVCASGTKALGVPPGIAPVTVSERAWQKIQNRRTKIPSLYLNYWRYLQPPIDPSRTWCPTPTTPATTLIRALNQSLQKLEDEGFENVYERHRRAGELVRRTFTDWGFKFLAWDEQYASNTVTAIKWPQGFNYERFWNMLNDEYDIILGNVPPERKSWFRVAHMGENSKLHKLAPCFTKIRDALKRIGYVGA